MKTGYNWDNMDHLDDDEENENTLDDIRQELLTIVHYIKKEIKNQKISAYVSPYNCLIICCEISCVEIMGNITSIMEEIKSISDKFLKDFNYSNFEIVMDRDNPTIYCSYERI